jgi:hypothetical protein
VGDIGFGRARSEDGQLNVAVAGGAKLQGGLAPAIAGDQRGLIGEGRIGEGPVGEGLRVDGVRAVMNGVNAGDMDPGFMADIHGKGVAASDRVSLASAMSMSLKQTPDAPTMADLGVDFNADGYFVFVGPAGMPLEACDALAAAIDGAISTEGMEVQRDDHQGLWRPRHDRRGRFAGNDAG